MSTNADMLRSLVIRDPKAARDLFLAEFSQPGEYWREIMTDVSGPSDGRIRQLIANALRNHPDLDKARAVLREWLGCETDEFAKRATESALAGGDKARDPIRRIRQASTAETYRYLASRMTHEIRNGLYRPKTQSSRLRRLINDLPEGQLRADLFHCIAELDEGLVTVGRLVEMQEGDETHFELKPILLHQWLESMNIRYASAYSRIAFQCFGTGEIQASEYTLRRIFWNLWVNAHKAVGNGCRIMVNMNREGQNLVVTISDNGDGYAEDQAEMMFEASVAKEAHRGRGLLEVQDGVLMLGGAIRPIKDHEGRYRLEIKFKHRKK